MNTIKKFTTEIVAVVILAIAASFCALMISSVNGAYANIRDNQAEMCLDR